jgi:hypothetical protein
MLMYERTDELDALITDFAREVQADDDQADASRATAG